MIYDVDDTGRVWSDLRRKEDDLKWGGHTPGFGRHSDSMGRPASTSSNFGFAWGNEQMGRVSRVRRALDESGPMSQRMIAQSLSHIDLSTIWHILISACQDIALYYGGSVLAGGFIGGAGGVLFWRGRGSGRCARRGGGWPGRRLCVVGAGFAFLCRRRGPRHPRSVELLRERFRRSVGADPAGSPSKLRRRRARRSVVRSLPLGAGTRHLDRNYPRCAGGVRHVGKGGLVEQDRPQSASGTESGEMGRRKQREVAPVSC